jgi:hypothetical protein
MPLATFLTLALLAGEPGDDAPKVQPPVPAVAPAAQAEPAGEGWEEFPRNVPHDDYGLVSWCYGALDEYLSLYEVVKPDLKDIDKMFGSPVKEAEPYAEDVAGERQALRRFAAAMEAAEKASPRVIAPRGAEMVGRGRSIWSAAKLQPHRKLADAWLFWGVPKRCETTAKSLKTNATLLGQAMAVDAPTVDAPAAPNPAPAH